MKRIHSFIIQTLFFTTTLLLIFARGYTQERDALDVLVNPEDKALIEDIIETSQTISAESQAKLQEISDNWQKLKDDFPNLPKPLQDKINQLDNNGFSRQLSGFKNQFEQFDEGLKGLLDKKEKIDKVIYFYERYRPDSQNPFRSLEVMKNIFDDVESLLPEEGDYDYIRKPYIWLIRTGIRYFKQGIESAYGGLKNIQAQIKNRAGNCIGYVGGDGTADSSDPRRKAFTDLNTGDIICYTGLRPVGGEIYTNTNGDGVYIWSTNKWTKLNPGLGVVNTIFTDWKIAYQKVITAEEIIYWCNNQLLLYQNARQWGTQEYDKLNSLSGCQKNILFYQKLETNLDNLMNSENGNKVYFVANYIFNIGNIRSEVKLLSDAVSNTVIFDGLVKDELGKPVSNATVSIKTETRERITETSEYGVFQILAEIPETDRNNLPFTLKVNAPNSANYNETSKITGQCVPCGTITLRKTGLLTIIPKTSLLNIGELVEFQVMYSENNDSRDVTSLALNNPNFMATSPGNFVIQASYNGYIADASVEVANNVNCLGDNEIWDETIQQCVCITGFHRDEQGICVEDEEETIPDLICSDPNSEKIWDENQQKFVCNCLENFIIDPNSGLCIPDVSAILNNADCANVADAVANWDPFSQQVICSCTKNYYTWDVAQKKCVPDIQAILNNSDCSQWPNTEPKWDYTSGEPYCDCVNGYKWNDDYTKCISLQEQMVAQTDCSQYGNARAVWDPVNEEVACECLPGYEWDENYTKCISIALAGMQNFDCSGYPNTEAVWDPVSNQAYCDCLPGYEWNDNFTGCEQNIQQQQQQQVQYDCSHLPNSRPVFDPVLNEMVCDCMPGYEWNNNFTACVPVRNKPNIDWGSIISMTNDILTGINMGNQGMFPSGTGSFPAGTSMQQPVQHQSNCNDQQQAGANTPEVHTIDLGQSFGTFIFDYETFTAKDQIIITNGGQTIFNTGCVGERKSVQLNLSGFSPTISVRVNPNCDGGSSTQWNFTVHCPNN